MSYHVFLLVVFTLKYSKRIYLCQKKKNSNRIYSVSLSEDLMWVIIFMVYDYYSIKIDEDYISFQKKRLWRKKMHMRCSIITFLNNHVPRGKRGTDPDPG